MAFDIKKLLGAVAPMIGTAFGGPLGGAAATMVVQKLGLVGQVDPQDQGKVEQAIQDAVMTPEGLIKMREVDTEFSAKMKELDISLEKLDADDRANARSREVSVRDYTPEVGFYLLIGTFAFFLRWLFKYPVPPDNKAIIYSAVGSLGTLVIMAATYFYGTTRGSQNKDAMLAASTPKLLKP